ncbi:hypothetical protein [Sedimentitalea sp.]|uniref:hypothetical protein n=1 Tax=Sedimentitalea sp. TaxID=2048915 RepID=UPI003297E9C0
MKRMSLTILYLSCGLLSAVSVAADDWDVRPTTGLVGPIDGAGPDGIPNNGDDYDGANNAPDLRGPDGLPGTGDDLELYISGTASGRAGCFTNNITNCAGAAGRKSAEWSLVQQVDLANCRLSSTLTNTSDGEPGCPGRGCIFEWSSPQLPGLDAAVNAALDIAPLISVSGNDGPGPGANCRLTRARYRMGWNPETDPADMIVLDSDEPDRGKRDDKQEPLKQD